MCGMNMQLLTLNRVCLTPAKQKGNSAFPIGRFFLAKLLKHKEPASASIDGQFCEEKAININADGYLL